MRRNFILCVILGLIFIGVLGCDKIKIPVSKKAEVVEVKVAPSGPQAKGTVIAKVNNISIGLDDLNQEIEIYNANVPEDKPDLKITTKEQKVNYLKNEVVRRTLLYQSAIDKGLDRNEDVITALDKTKMLLCRILSHEFLKIFQSQRIAFLNLPALELSKHKRVKN